MEKLADYQKVSFLCGIGGNASGIGDYAAQLDLAGRVCVLASYDDYGVIHEVANLRRASGIPHLLAFRAKCYGENGQPEQNPDYNLSPELAAQQWWNLYKNQIPPEFDKEFVWLIMFNEGRKEDEWGDWWGRVALKCSQMANEEGYKVLSFGWSLGTPEHGQYESAGMRDFLTYCAYNQGVCGICVHEGAEQIPDAPIGSIPLIGNIPHISGRYRKIFDICDQMGIGRPRIFVTECAWTYRDVPALDVGLSHVVQASEFYGQDEEVLGVALWYLGNGYMGIADKLQPYIEEVKNMSLSNQYDGIPNWPEYEQRWTPEPPILTYVKQVHLVPQDTTLDEWVWVSENTHHNRNTMAFSADDTVGIMNLQDTRHEGSKIIVYGVESPERWGNQNIVSWLLSRVPDGIVVEGRTFPIAPSLPGNPLDGLELGPPFGTPFTITSPFDAPRDYGNGKHEGADYDIFTNNPDSQEPVLCLYDGTVIEVVYKETGYGNHIIMEHMATNGGKFRTLIAHLDIIYVQKFDFLPKGARVGEIGATGNATGEHVHINLEAPGYGLSGYVRPNVVDPDPYINKGQVSPYVRFGIHGPADPAITDNDRQMLIEIEPELIKILSNVNKSDLAVTATQHSLSSWVIRAFLDFGGRTISPQQFFEYTIQDIKDCLSIVGNWPIELHNEPNLQQEGLWASWNTPQEFNDWIIEVLNLYRQELPNAKFVFPALSPGHAIDNIRWDENHFVQACSVAIGMFDYLGIHAYWDDRLGGNGFSHNMDRLAWYDYRFRGKPVFITESSSVSPESTEEQKAYSYIDFHERLRYARNLMGVCYFVLSASNPDWSWETGSGEVWTHKMSNIVKGRN